jgi:hypothetical protein
MRRDGRRCNDATVGDVGCEGKDGRGVEVRFLDGVDGGVVFVGGAHGSERDWCVENGASRHTSSPCVFSRSNSLASKTVTDC